MTIGTKKSSEVPLFRGTVPVPAQLYSADCAGCSLSLAKDFTQVHSYSAKPDKKCIFVREAKVGTASGRATGKFGETGDNPALIAPADTQSFVFTEAGEFPYYCVLHPSMVGTISVR